MEASNVVALVAAGLAAIVAVWVPWLAFRFALRQERAQWLHEQRAQLYTEMLTEAFAVQHWFVYRLTEHGERRGMTDPEELLLTQPERARLATQASIFGSHHVNDVFILLTGEAPQGGLAARPGRRRGTHPPHAARRVSRPGTADGDPRRAGHRLHSYGHPEGTTRAGRRLSLVLTSGTATPA